MVLPPAARLGQPPGGRLFHILSGNLGHQIEHHLFPDLPAHRYAEISLEVRNICERYGIPYNAGPLRRQFGSVVAKIVRLALPPRGTAAAEHPAAQHAAVAEPSRDGRRRGGEDAPATSRPLGAAA